MFDLRLALLLASLVAAATAAPRCAQATNAPPIRVSSCRTIVEPHGRRGPVQQTIQVSFANDRDVAADIARFTLLDSTGAVKAFVARGSFSKGVIIADRILPAESSADERFFNRERTTECALTYVHFVDGSSWSAAP